MNSAISKSLMLILDAKENRTALKEVLANQGLASMTLSLNIPGIPKSSTEIKSFFDIVLADLKTFLQAHRNVMLWDKEQIIDDEAGNFYILPFKAKNKSALLQLKALCEEFEQQHALGRLIDVDVFSHDSQIISSGKEKTCYYCGSYSAIDCMRNKRHSYKDLRKKISVDIALYLREHNKTEFVRNITILAQKALLYEVSLSPKPGLVDFESSGVHQDMNYFSFLDSTSAITPYFQDICYAAFTFDDEWSKALPLIRQIGIQAESSMFRATHGVNTQKGLIFLMGVSLFAYSYLFINNKKLNYNNLRSTIKKIAHNLVTNELLNNNIQHSTHGEKVFAKYGNSGIRYEVEHAFPSIFKSAIPFLQKNFDSSDTLNKEQINKLLKTALLKIMAHNMDANILYRGNMDILIKVQEYAKKAILSSDYYSELCTYCKQNNISPGGSADLLALSLFLHFVETQLTRNNGF